MSWKRVLEFAVLLRQFVHLTAEHLLERCIEFPYIFVVPVPLLHHNMMQDVLLYGILNPTSRR